MESVEKQSYRFLEIVISDDESIDNTLKLVTLFQNKTTIPIRIFKHIPCGIASNWNHVIEKAEGTYIKFLFQDDLLDQTCIERMIEVITTETNIGLVTCKRKIITDDDNHFTQAFKSSFKDLQINLSLSDAPVSIRSGKDLLNASYFKKKPINIIGEPTSYLFRKSLIEEIGGFHTHMFQLVDYEFCLRIFKGYSIAFIKDSLVSFRLHGTQASFVNHQDDSNDKDLFYRLLYTKYFWLLHSNFNWLLIKKFHWSVKFYRTIRYRN